MSYLFLSCTEKKYTFNGSDFETLKDDFVLTKRTTAILINANRAKLDADNFSFLKDEYGFSAKKVNTYLLDVLHPDQIDERVEEEYLTLKEASEVLGIYYELTSKLFSTNRILTKKALYTTNFTEPLSYQDSAFLKLPKFP